MHTSRLRSTNLFTSAFLALYFAGSFGLSLLFAMLPMKEVLRSALYGPLLYLAVFGLPALIYFLHRRAPGETAASFFGFRRLPLRSLLLVCAAALLVQPTMMLISALSQLLFQNITSSSMLEMAQIPLPLLLLSSAVFPAFFEELICRGIILKGYRQTPCWYALVLPALFFGLLHLNLQQAVYAIAGGLFFALLVKITDSLWSSIVAHLLINGLQSLLSWSLLHSGLYDLASELPQTTELLTGPEMILAQLMLPLMLTALTLPPLIFCLIALAKNHQKPFRSLAFGAAPNASAFGGLHTDLLPADWHKGAWIMYLTLGLLLLNCVANELFLYLA